eukprot:PhM_4_TR6343/c0_g1_i1/m.9
MITVAFIAGVGKIVHVVLTRNNNNDDGGSGRGRIPIDDCYPAVLEDAVEDTYGVDAPRSHVVVLQDHIRNLAAGVYAESYWCAVRDSGAIIVSGMHAPTCVLRFGVPEDMRRGLWLAASGASQLAARSGDAGYYAACHGRVSPEAEAEIKKDLQRTLPRSRLRTPEAQEALRRVLGAAATHSAGSYCQGMNVLAGFLLLVYGIEHEADAFYTLVAVTEGVRFSAGYYDRRLSGALRDTKVLGRFLSEQCPELHSHVTGLLNVSPAEVFMDWLLCAFIDILPTEWAVRVWDLFLAQGSCVLITVAAALLRHHSPLLLECDEATAISGVRALRAQVRWSVEVDDVLVPVFRDPSRHLTPCRLEDLRKDVLLDDADDVGLASAEVSDSMTMEEMLDDERRRRTSSVDEENAERS